MPSLEISKLPALAGQDIQPTDPLPVADLSASETKKLTIKNLVQFGSATVDPGSIPSDRISSPLPANYVATASIQDLAVTTGKIAVGTIVSSNIADNGLLENNYDAGSVSSRAIELEGVLGGVGGNIAPATITAYNLANAAVEVQNLAADSVATIAIQDGAITTAKYFAGSIDNTALGADCVTDVKILDATISYAKTNFQTGDMPGTVITADTIGATQIAPESITSSELADLSVDTAAIIPGSVTGGTGGSLAGTTIVDDNVAPATLTARVFAPGAVDNLALADASVSTSKLQDLAATEDKIAPFTGSAKIIAGTIQTAQLEDLSVTNGKLGLASVNTDQLAAGAVVDSKVSTGISGTKISTDTLPAGSINPAALDRGLDKATGAVGIANAITPGVKNGISFTSQGLIDGTSNLLPGDLPIATLTEVGGVLVPLDGGLTVALDGSLGIGNVLDAGTMSGISWDGHGSITGAVPLIGTDLPVPTDTTRGGVAVPDEGLVVDGSGSLSLASVGAVGEWTKTTVDQYGRVVGGAVLAPTDIPALDTSKITTGVFPTERIAPRSLIQEKLANYSVALIQEDIPTPDPGGPAYHIGMSWFQESTGTVSIWNGNSWQVTSRGALASENLRWAGTIDASTGLVATLTDFGVTAGLEVGAGLPDATNNNGGIYLVVSVAGAAINVASVSGLSFGVGDWVLAVDATAGWIRLDIAAGGGGGGGGAASLDQLDDVTLAGLVNKQFLEYNSTSGQWENKTVILYTALEQGDIIQYYGGQLTYATEISGGSYDA